MSADDLWCSWCRQPHAPCATIPAMEAERAATLRARLQERYERPERPCTYDPADEEPEAEPVAGHLHIAGLGPVVRYTPPEDPGMFPGVGHWPELTPTGTTDAVSEWRKAQRFEAQYPTDDWTPPRPEPVEYGGTPFRYGSLPGCTVDPSARADEILRHPLTGTSTWGTLTLPPGGDAFEVKPDPLRSYLRALTNPDATPEDVNGALDALTPEDRALVSEALPSWGSARMARVEAIAPFMDRFETMVRERDPRAQEEGTLILSALLEDDPTRSTIETLMEIAKTPKVTP